MSKEAFVQVLKDEGYNAGYANNGIPTVFVKNPIEIGYKSREIKKIAIRSGYTESYGISQEAVKGTMQTATA